MRGAHHADGYPNNPVIQDKIDFPQLISGIWNGKWVIAGFLAASLALAIIYLRTATYMYTAELRVVPVQGASSAASRLGGLSSLASIAGVNIPMDPGAAAFQLYAESVESPEVAADLATDRKIMEVVFQSEWNEARRRFAAPEPGALRQLSEGMKRFLGVPRTPWRRPNAARLKAYLKDSVKVSQNTKSPVMTLNYRHEDPEFAEYFLLNLHRVIDGNLRRKALRRSTQHIQYLSRQLRLVTLAEHRTAIAEALSEQEKVRMMASSSLPFAADTFGNPTSSLQPTNPRPLVVLVLSVIVGAFLGTLGALLTSHLRRQKAQRLASELPAAGA